MAERIYMVEQIEVQHARFLSCWATYRLAERKVEKLLATMPRGSRDHWKKRPKQKRNSPNHGKTEMVWGCNAFGPSTRHVSAFAVVSFEIQGSAIDRLAELARGRT